MRALVSITAAAAAAVLAAGASAATVHCLAASIGPGSHRQGGTAGARCLLAQYHDHCHAADYELSAFGVDTVRQESFRLVVSMSGWIT